MALFRPYEQGKRDENATPRTTPTPPASDDTAAGVEASPARRFGRRGGATAVTPGASSSTSTTTARTTNSAPTVPPVAQDADDRDQNRAPRVKQGPTPTRKEAERARMERLHPTLTPKEQKAQARANDRVARERRFEAVENSPARVLVRDYVDARWTIVEFMIPLMILVMALTMAATLFSPRLMYWLTFGMYAVFLAAIINVVILWRGFKRELQARQPGTPTRGLLNYMINRAMLIRRFRRPSPRLNRGAAY